MKEQRLALAPHLCLITASGPSPAQAAAWRQLWQVLLADGPQNTKALSTDDDEGGTPDE